MHLATKRRSRLHMLIMPLPWTHAGKGSECTDKYTSKKLCFLFSPLLNPDVRPLTSGLLAGHGSCELGGGVVRRWGNSRRVNLIIATFLLSWVPLFSKHEHRCGLYVRLLLLTGKLKNIEPELSLKNIYCFYLCRFVCMFCNSRTYIKKNMHKCWWWCWTCLYYCWLLEDLTPAPFTSDMPIYWGVDCLESLELWRGGAARRKTLIGARLKTVQHFRSAAWKPWKWFRVQSSVARNSRVPHDMMAKHNTNSCKVEEIIWINFSRNMQTTQISRIYFARINNSCS